MSKVPKISLHILQYLQKSMEGEVHFLPADSPKYAQSTQNNKFTISLQYLKENMKDGVDFLPADKRQRFYQSDNIILDVCDQSCPNYPK